jgi:hypothetical protein
MRPRSPANRLLVGSLLVASSLGCGEQDVIVAYTGAADAGSGREASTVEGDAGQDGPTGEWDVEQDDSGFQGDGDSGCPNNKACNGYEFCSKWSCEAPRGQCQLYPDNCNNQYDPVCGCDGTTYWNDCLRQLDGVSSSTPGLCTEHIEAGGGAENPPCLADGICNRLAPGPGACDPNSRGVCWVLPLTCPQDAGGEWSRCSGGPLSCTDLCDAIKSGQPYELSNNMCP